MGARSSAKERRKYWSAAGAEKVGFGEAVSPQWVRGLGRGLCPSHPRNFFGFFASEWCILRAFWHMIRQFTTHVLTRNKSNDYFESMQYRQDMRQIAHYHKRKHSVAIHVVQKIIIIRVQKIGKFAVWNLILCTGAIWRSIEKFEYRCTTTYHPL